MTQTSIKNALIRTRALYELYGKDYPKYAFKAPL